MIITEHAGRAMARGTLVILQLMVILAARAQCPGVRPSFTWASDGSALVFTDMTEGYIDSRNWSFGDGNIGEGSSIYHTYDLAGADTVTLALSSYGCVFQLSALVIHPGANDVCASQLTSSFSTTPAGNNNLLFTDQSQSDGSPLLYLWIFGDDSTSFEPSVSHFYVLPGAYDVSHSIGTVDSLFQTACVAGSAQRVFVNGNTSTCDTSVFFTLSGSIAGNDAYLNAEAILLEDSLALLNWDWDYGDGSLDVTQLPGSSHYYPYPGEYQVCVDVHVFDSAQSDTCFARACTTLTPALVGVEEQVAVPALKAWPIPFNEDIRVEGAAVRGGARWRLLDVLGRESRSAVFSHDQAELLVFGTLPTGVYTLIVPREHGVSSLRLLKQ